MKKILLLGIFTITIFFASNAQFAFSVKPGLNLNGASFGYKSGNFVPYAGLQFLSTKTTLEYDYDYNPDYYDPYNNEYYGPEDSKDEYNMAVYMPYVGLKYFFFSSESLKTSLSTTFFKPIIKITEKEDGEEIKDLPENSIFGGEISFGSEYFFNEQFSLGGEFGYRYGAMKNESKKTETRDYVRTEDLKLNMSFVSVSLNFYF